jgi:hypothetical protein
MTGEHDAAAVEPAEEHGRDAGRCLNCGARRLGPFCQACGQSGHVHRSLGGIGHDLAHGVFHFEGRIWHTLPMLLVRPGALTRRYIDGERARFVSPLALFLFILFVLFAMLSVIGAHLEWSGAGPGGDAARAKMALKMAQDGERITVLSRQRSQATTPTDVARLDKAIAEKQTNVQALQAAMEASRGELTWLKQVHTGWKRLDKGLGKAAENPNLILYKLQSNAYKFAWALIPLSLPFMWLLFPFSRRFNAYDHAVFITYSLCFVSLLLVAVTLADMAGVAAEWLFLLVCVAVPLHLYKQLRGTYGLGRWSGLARMALLLVATNTAIVLFALLLVGLGLVG